MVSIVALSLPFCLLFINVCTVASKEYVRGCYYTNWAQYRPNEGKYVPEDYIPGLCTHILFAFVGMNDDYSLKNVEWNDIPVDGAGNGLYKRLNDLKSKDLGLKTLFSIGGWNFGTAKFKAMASTDENRKKFAANAVAYARKWDFDGIDIDWEYPQPADKKNHAALMRELRSAAEAEAQSRGVDRLLIAAAVSPGQATIDGGYDGASLGRDLDFLFLMSYDYWGSWSNNIGFNSPLYGRQGMSTEDKILNTEWSASHWNQAGVPKEKIIIGLAMYGRGWKLDNPTSGIPQSKGNSAPCPAKKYTREAGIAAYYEICDVIVSGGVRYWQDEQKVPYVIKDGTEWWGYDDKESITHKVNWLKSQGYGGAFVWTLDFDDFKGKCPETSGQKYPLLNAIRKELTGSYVPAPEQPAQSSTLPVPYPTSGPVSTESKASGPYPTPAGSSGKSSSSEFSCTSDGFFPDPANCYKFYRCVAGEKFSFNCAPGTSFHVDTNQCEYTDVTKCA